MIKKYVIIFISFTFINLTSYAQWYQTAIDGQESFINNISVVNDNIVWAMDQLQENISVTTDGGGSWITKELPDFIQNSYCGGMCAVNESKAYLVVSDGVEKGIYITTDMANTWTKQTTAFDENSLFPNFVYFWNENEGMAVGDGLDYFEIYTTSNGGNQWNLVPTLNIPPNITGETTYNSNDFFRVHSNRLYFSTKNGRIFYTTNKGYNWEVINTPITSDGMNFSFDFKDTYSGLISYYDYGNNDLLYSTSDGGNNWTQHPVNITNYIDVIRYSSLTNTYYSNSANRGLAYSIDNGLTWTIHEYMNFYWHDLGPGIVTLNFSPSGKFYAGGVGYMFFTNNFLGANPTVLYAEKIDDINIDITFSTDVELLSSQTISNYTLKFNYDEINLISALRDSYNHSLVHLTAETSFPNENVTIWASGVTDLNGVPVLSKSVNSFYELGTSSIFNHEKIIEIYPNPTSKIVNVNSEIYNIKKILITDIRGKILINNSERSQNHSIDLSGYANGIYILSIQTGKEIFTTKIIKE